MAALRQKIKLFQRTKRDAADVTALNTAVQTYIANGAEGVADGCNVDTSLDVELAVQGQSILFAAVSIGG